MLKNAVRLSSLEISAILWKLSESQCHNYWSEVDSNPSSGVYIDQRLIAGPNRLGHPLAHRWAFHINSPKQRTAKRVSNKMSQHSADLSQANLAVVGSFQWRATDYLASSKTDSPIDLKLLHLVQGGDSDRCKFPSLHFLAKLLHHCSASILVWKTSMSTRASHWRLCWKSPLLISYPMSEWPWICCLSGRHLCRPRHLCWKSPLSMSEWPWICCLSERHLCRS